MTTQLWLLRAGLLLAVVGWVVARLWCRDGYTEYQQEKSLDAHGQQTSATVLSQSYDPDGGDPGGWTSLEVKFTTTSGTTEHAVVGHHDGPAEEVGGPVLVLYDPQHPSNADAVNGRDLSRIGPLDVVIGVVFLGAVSVVVVGFVVAERWTVRRRRRSVRLSE